MDLGADGIWIERLGMPGGAGFFTVNASAVIKQAVPLPASALENARRVAGALEAMNDAQKRRSAAAAYWLEQSRVAPDAAQRVPAACFAIEAAINTSGEATTEAYLEAIAAMGFSAATGNSLTLVAGRVKRILDMRAAVVHHGQIDKPATEPDVERWVRDLAGAVVRHKIGLGAPATLAILENVVP